MYHIGILFEEKECSNLTSKVVLSIFRLYKKKIICWILDMFGIGCSVQFSFLASGWWLCSTEHEIENHPITFCSVTKLYRQISRNKKVTSQQKNKQNNNCSI